MSSCDNITIGGEHDLAEGAVLIDGCGCAVTGASEDGRAIYSYELLIEHFSKHEGMESLDDPDYPDDAAIEWIDYNVLGGLPYANGMRPMIVDQFGHDLADPDAECDDGDY